MANLVDLLNVGRCSTSQISGTSTDFCKLDIKRIKELWRFPYNFKLPADFKFTLPNIQALQEAGKLVKIYVFKSSEDTTPQNEINTYPGGDKTLKDKMPKEFTANLENGIQGYQAILSLERAGMHSFMIVDKEEQIFMAKGKDGIARGLNSIFFQVEDYKPQGDENAGFKINWQLERRQFDNELHGLKSEDYDFNTDDVYGVTDLDLIVTAPSNSDTTMDFTVLRNTDRRSFNQEGLEALTNWKLKVDGTVIAGTVSATTNGYQFTRTTGTFATDEIVTLELPIEFLNDIPYRAFDKSVVVL